MKNKILILLLVILFITSGCTKKDKIYLNDEYYNNGDFIVVDNEELDKLDGNFIVFSHNNFCSLGVPCEDIFKLVMEKYKIDFLKIQFDLFKESKYYEYVKYAPSIIIIKSGKVISYLDADKDEDLDKYQDTNEFEKWLNNYIYLKK